MAKAKTAYVCNQCGAEHTRWQGQCAACGAWDTLSEFVVEPATAAGKPASKRSGYAGQISARITPLTEVALEIEARSLIGIGELDRVLGGHPKQHTLVFQVDLWNARGALPKDLGQVLSRQKDIQYSSRTRTITDLLERAHQQRHILRELLERIPPGKHDALCAQVAEMARDERYNVVHLIYRDKVMDGHEKDYQFGRRAMLRHWQAGLADARTTLQHADWFALPDAARPFVTHDLHRHD